MISCSNIVELTNFLLETGNGMIYTNNNAGAEELVLDIVTELKLERFYVQKTLVLTSRTSMQNTFPLLLKKRVKYNGLQCSLITGTKKEKKSTILKKCDVFIANYDFLVSTQWEKILLFDFIIVDEMSEFSNPKTKRYLHLLDYVKKGKWLVGITNDFFSSKPLELWAQYYLLDGGERLEHHYKQFLEKYFFLESKKETKGFNIIPKNDSFSAILKAVNNITRYYNEVEEKRKVLYVKLSAVEYSKYIFYRARVLVGQKEEKATSILLSQAILLLQAANGIVYEIPEERIIHRQKIECLKRIIGRSGGKVLIIYWFIQDKKFVLDNIREVVAVEETSDIEIWNEGETEVGIARPDLWNRNVEIKADVLIWFAMPLSLGLYNLVNKNFLKQNIQGRIIHVVTENTIDETVYNTITRKSAKQEDVKETLLEGVF